MGDAGKGLGVGGGNRARNGARFSALAPRRFPHADIRLPPADLPDGDAGESFGVGTRKLAQYCAGFGRPAIVAHIRLPPGDENEVRKDFTQTERLALKQAIEARIGERQGQRTDLLVQNFAQVPPGTKTRDYAAEKAGFGNAETARQVEIVVERRMGELLIAMRESGQRATRGDTTQDRMSRRATSTLENLGIPRDRASRAQQLAIVPEHQFEARFWRSSPNAWARWWAHPQPRDSGRTFARRSAQRTSRFSTQIILMSSL